MNYIRADFYALISFTQDRTPTLSAVAPVVEADRAFVYDMVWDDHFASIESMLGFDSYKTAWEDSSLYFPETGLFVVNTHCWGEKTSGPEGTEYDTGIEPVEAQNIKPYGPEDFGLFFAVRS